MSKAEGKKIVIKFTQPLIGDVTANLSAFRVSGQEYKHVGGPLLNKTYTLASITRPLNTVLYQSTSQYTLDDNIPIASTIEETANGTQMSMNEFGVGWETFRAFDKNESTMWYASGTTDRWVGLDFGVAPRRINRFRMYRSDGRFRGFVFEASNNNSSWTTLTSGEFPSGNVWNDISFTNTTLFRYYRLRCTSVYIGSNVSVSELEMYNVSSPVYPTVREVFVGGIPTTNFPAQVRLQTQATIPPGTSVKFEYGFGVTTPTVWTEVKDLIPIGTDPLWLKYTLETTNTSVTPIVTSVILEDPVIPQDKILITTTDLSRFNNVVGGLTVLYDGALGNLAGVGGSVASFTRVFTPTDLLRKPNPHSTEQLNVSINPTLSVTQVYYQDRRSSHENISVSIVPTLALIRVSLENPSPL